MKNQTANQHRFRENLQPSNSKFKQQRTFIIVDEQVVSIVLMASPEFEKIFLILLTMTTLLIKMSFLFRSVQYFLTRKKTANLLTQISKQVQKKLITKFLKSFKKLWAAKNTVIPPLQSLMTSARVFAIYAPTNGAVEATPVLERSEALLILAALITMTDGRPITQITKPHSHTYTLDKVCSSFEL